ncbi:MAG TPA: hypothetical protein PKC43_11465 [Phycisphaerales bacterium]|nr:hypothetical protein [Phycisphaerales bacterium]HMP38050.1 hypothetical protein [Phycisphaerales bacterium]
MTRRRRRILRALALAVIPGVVAGAGSGCQKALFPEDQPRTPFELHDRMRSRYRPTQEFDVFGRPQPALRSRLGPENR